MAVQIVFQTHSLVKTRDQKKPTMARFLGHREEAWQGR